MRQRVLVAVIGVPLLIAVLSVAPSWAAMLLIAALCAIGAHELMYAAASETGKKVLSGAAVSMALLVPVFIFQQTELFAADRYPMLATLAFLFVFLLFLSSIFHYGKTSRLLFSDLMTAVFAGLVIPLMLSCLLRLRLMDYGPVLVFVPLAIAFGSDTLALFAGMLFGKHKLAPTVSPHKTIEGSIGGLLGGVLGLLVLKWIAYAVIRLIFLTYGQVVLFGVVGSLISQVGDLSFSVIKREFGIKDYGRLLPGHGGVLDRFDSVTFLCPVIWFIFSFLQ